MNGLESPIAWLEGAIVVALAGALLVSLLRNSANAWRWGIVFSGAVFACAAALCIIFYSNRPAAGPDGLYLGPSEFGSGFLFIDGASAPLFPSVALVYLVTVVTTQRTKIPRFSFAWTLVSEAITLATFAARTPWHIAMLLVLGFVPILIELGARRRSIGVLAAHIGLCAVLLCIGCAAWDTTTSASGPSWMALVPILAAILIRAGIFPAHCWLTDLFEHATFGTALVFALPLTGAYAAARLIVPVSPDWLVRGLGLLCLATAFYAASMAVVQREGRRFFAFLLLSQSALVLVGLEMLSLVGLAGALCVWISTSISLAGVGLSLRAVEARVGRLNLAEFHGLYDDMPSLAVFFLISGLASVGFPGTFGFVGMELLVDGAIQTYPYAGAAMVVVSALNGIAVVQAYLRVFTGKNRRTTICLKARPPERAAILVLTAIIFAGGLYPQPAVSSRHNAAVDLLSARSANRLDDAAPHQVELFPDSSPPYHAAETKADSRVPLSAMRRRSS